MFIYDFILDLVIDLCHDKDSKGPIMFIYVNDFQNFMMP